MSEEMTEGAAVGGVMVTWSMMIMGIAVALIVELVKVILGRWSWFTAEMKKPLLPLLGIGLSMLIFSMFGIDDWLIGGILIGLSAGGGYDFVQGVIQKKPGKPKAIMPVLIVCSLLLSGGCFNMGSNPKAELLASQKTFIATVDSLTALQKAGKFNAEETAEITRLIHQGQAYLEQWQTDLKSGQTHPDVIQSFQNLLDMLIDYNLKKGGES